MAAGLVGFGAPGCAGNCSGHGVCSVDGFCTCDRYWTPPDCSVNYEQDYSPAAYTAIYVATTVLMIGSAVWTARSLLLRRCVASADERARMLPLCRNEREMAALANLVGCILRPFWFISLGESLTAEGIFVNNITDAVLLRAPQCAWLTAYLCMVLVWRSIVMSADGRTVGCGFRGMVAFVVIAINVVALPLAIVARAVPAAPDFLHMVGNGIMALVVAIILLGGLYTVWVLRRRIRALELELASMAPVPASPRPGDDLEAAKTASVFRVIHNTFCHVSLAVVMGAVLVAAVVVSTLPVASPRNHPDVYVWFVAVVHVFVEGWTAVQLAVLTSPQQVRQQPQGALGPGGRGEKDTLLAAHGGHWGAAVRSPDSGMLYEEETEASIGSLVHDPLDDSA